jgi:aminoglycoside 6'-N-acetyltransferase
VHVDLRPLTDDDLPLLHGWLQEPGVVRWWEGDDVSWEAVVRDYGSGADDRVEHWLASVAGRPVGWIECYAIASHLEEDEVQRWLELGVERSAAGIDYLVGEPAERGRGLGSAMIATFVEEVVFGQHPDWTHVCASPSVDNVASCRALVRAGFEPAGEFTDQHGRCRLYSLTRGARGPTDDD